MGQTPSTWLIGFDSKATKERILNSSPCPMVLNTKIIDANENSSTPVIVTCNGKFRIHKLPPHTQIATIQDFLMNKVKIKSLIFKNIQKEKFKNTEIKNGVISFQISYALEDHNRSAHWRQHHQQRESLLSAMRTPIQMQYL